MRKLEVVVGAIMLCVASAMLGQDGSSTASQDKTFVKKSAEGGMTEIEAGKLALKKSKNDDVRSFAQRMIDDHTKLMADMKPLANQMGVPPPTKLSPSDQEEMARLKGLSGEKFDKEYVTVMVADHHKDLGEFKNERDTTANAELKTVVSKGTEVIQQHVDMIDQIAQKMGIDVLPASGM